MKKVAANTIDSLLHEAKVRNITAKIPSGKTFKDLSTIIIVPNRGTTEEKHSLNCKKCKTKNEFTTTVVHGFHPLFVESFKRLVKPMNVPVLDMVVGGYEVGEAYNIAIESILSNPALADFKYILTIEDDNLVPYIPNTQGPLMMLYEDIEKGYDVVGGLYWTKGLPSLPLIYGDPKEKPDSKAGYFKVRYPSAKKGDGGWKDGDLVECNGMGMGFTLFKLDIFRDQRLTKPWFKTVTEQTNSGPKIYTQDLYFFEKVKKLGYKVAIDTRVKVGHLDVKTGTVY